MTASRLKRSFVPQFDMLEDRCVPAAVSVSNIFSIASQVYQNQAQLGAFKANPTAFEATAAARASAINQLDQILGESKSEIASLQAINDQATKTAQGQIASLEKYRAQQDTAIVNEYNQEIKDFNKFLSQFDGATQKAFADQIAQYKNALAQDASAKLIRTGDYVNGQEVL